MTAANTEQDQNTQTTETASGRRTAVAQVVATTAGLVTAVVLGFALDTPGIWGLLPLLMYAALLLLNVDVVGATAVALLSGFLMLQSGPAESAGILGEALGSDIVVIGLVIVLGAGLGEVLMRTGAAGDLVRVVIARFGIDSPIRAQLGIMLATAILVIALGTLIGAFALAAPLIIPIAARLGFTRSGTALMMFIGGTCGMFVAPFVGSMIAIRTASGIGYLEFVAVAGGPLAIACFTVGFFLVRWNLRHPADAADFYDDEDQVDPEETVPQHARASTLGFLAAFVVAVVYGVATEAGTAYAILALIFLSLVAGAFGRMRPEQLLAAIYDGSGRVMNFFLLFWLLGAMFAVIELMDPYTVILESYGSALETLGTFAFLLLVGLIGWIGIQGASAAQVVLVDNIFGSTATALGVPVSAWSVVLLASAQADTYGPWPGANMIAPVGLARSTALKRVLYTSWILLLVSLAVYAVELWLLI